MQINYASVLKAFPKLQANSESIQKFVKAIIKKYEEQKNPELTLRQIEQMYGTPIYIVMFEENKSKTGWYTPDGIIDARGVLTATNIYELTPYHFKVSEYSTTWIAFQYENIKYIDYANPNLNINDLSLEKNYYFICDDDKKTGWWEIVCIEVGKVKVSNDHDTYEYFDLDQYNKTWRAYSFYRKSI